MFQETTYKKKIMMKDGNVVDIAVTYSDIVHYLIEHGRKNLLTDDHDELFKRYLHARKIDYNKTLPKVKSASSNRGGKRENSGRKSKSGGGESPFVTFRCSQEILNILKKQPNKTKYIEDAVREKHRREERY